MKTENFVIAVIHFFCACGLKKWTAVTWQLYSAISMVATPHCGACSLSIDLRPDEISATGGHRLFVPNQRFGQLLNNLKMVDKTLP